MMAGDIVQFCDGTSLEAMLVATPNEWTRKWALRIQDYYFRAAKILDEHRCGFGSVALTCSAIEAIGTMMFPPPTPTGERFKKTAGELLRYTGKDPETLYKHYRCGLVHNGRTNQSGGYRQPNEMSAIDYDASDEFYIRTGKGGSQLIIVNPKKLVATVEHGFTKWLEKKNHQELGTLIRSEFAEDIDLVQKLDDFGR